MVRWVRGIRRGQGSGWRLRGGRGKGWKMGKGGQGREEGCRLSWSLPKVARVQVCWVGWAGEEVQDGVVGSTALRAQRGGESSDSVEIVPHSRGEARPQLCEGGPEGAGEAAQGPD